MAGFPQQQVIQDIAGSELGQAVLTNSYTLTVTPTVILSIPVSVPATVKVRVRGVCPWILNGATQGAVTLTLFEDAVQIQSSLQTHIVNGSDGMDVEWEYLPIVSGAHTYSLQASSTQAGTIEAGVVSGLNVNPSLTVVAA